MKNHIKLLLCSISIFSSSLQAATITAQTGQSFNFTNNANQTFNITYVGSTGRLTYTPGQFYDGADANTIDGFMSWANVTRTEFSSNGIPAISFTYTEDEFGDRYRTHTQILSPGNFITVDNISGKLISAGGLNAAIMQAPKFSGGLTGGKVEIKNVVAKFNTPSVAADADGLSLPAGTSKPATAYTLRGTGVWTYDAISGPSSFPQSTLTRSNIQAELKNAGYFIRSVTYDRITFFGVYKLSGLRFTPDGLDLYLKSLGYLSTWTNGIRNMNTNEPQGLGNLEVSVTLSMPMPAQ